MAAAAAVLCGGCSEDSIGSAIGKRKNAGADAGGVTPSEHTHVWGDWVVTVPATCEATGEETRTCTLDASHQESRAIAKLTGAVCDTGGHVHIWGEWVTTTPATCETAGIETRTCTLDASHQENRAIAKLTGAECNSGGGGLAGDYDYSLSCGTRPCRKKEMPDGKVWMTENLNYVVDSSWCYDNVPANCGTYGRLYQWAAAMDIDKSYNTKTWNGIDVKHKGVCPSGWHLPSRQEWQRLVDSAGGNSVAGKKLKSSSYWNVYSGIYIGTDEYGFSALPDGNRGPDGTFRLVGDHGSWWTATEYSGGNACGRNMGYDYGSANETNTVYKSAGRSVRCVSD